MSEPLVSILVPTYNGERFLKPALRSALGQSHRNLEVVVGDDASTDGTATILAGFAESDARVRVVRHAKNAGAWGNPALLLAEARGEYIKFLLHDDVLATNCVRELVRGMEQSPGTTLAFSRRCLVDGDGRPVAGHEFPRLLDRPGILDGRALARDILRDGNNVIGELTTVLFRRVDVDPAELLHIDGRRLEVLGDLAEFLKLLRHGDAFYTPNVLSRFRVHAEQNSQNAQFIARGVRDWPRLVDWAARNGLLDEPSHRRAQARALLANAVRVAELVDGPDCAPALEGLFLATAGLLELAAQLPRDPERDLSLRAHGPEVLGRLGQELETWVSPLAVAVAAPTADAAEIDATVRAFRHVLQAGAAGRLLLAVPASQVQEAEPLLEAALGQEPDIDVELVPTDDPGALVRDDWLAVVPRGATWHRGRATAVFAFDTVPSLLHT